MAKTDELEAKKVRKRKTKKTVAVAGSVLTAMNATAVPIVALAEQVTEAVESGTSSTTPTVEQQTSNVVEQGSQIKSGTTQTFHVYGSAGNVFNLTYDINTKKFQVWNNSALMGKDLDPSLSNEVYFKATSYRPSTGHTELLLNFKGRAQPGSWQNWPWFESLQFQIGDLITFYHIKADDMFRITGVPVNDAGTDYSGGVPKDQLDHTVYEVTAEGLKERINEKPVINLTEDARKPLYVLNADGLPDDLLIEGVTATDDRDLNGGLVPDKNFDLTSEIVVTIQKPLGQYGQGQLSYDVTDAGGRAAETETRELYVLPSQVLQVPGVEKGANGQLRLPEGSHAKQDGTVNIPVGDTIVTVKPDGSIEVFNTYGSDTIIHPEGTVQLPTGDVITGNATITEDGTVNIPTQNGNITVDSDGNITVPNGMNQDTEIEAGADVTVEDNGTVTVPNGSNNPTVITPEGTVELPNGAGTVTPNASVTVDANGNVTIPTANGTIEVDRDGSIKIPTTHRQDQDTTIDANGDVILPNGSTIPAKPGHNATVGQDGVVNVPADNGTITVDPSGSITVPNESTNNTVLKPGAPGTIESDGTVTIPNGSGETVINPNGDVTLSGGTVVTPNGDVTVEEDGTVKIPIGNITIEVDKDGNIKIPTTYPYDQDVTIDVNGNVTLPNGSTIQLNGNVMIDSQGNIEIPMKDGNVTVSSSDGTVHLQNGNIIHPDGTVELETENGTITYNPSEVVIGEDGSLTLLPSLPITIPTPGNEFTVTPTGPIEVDKAGNVKVPTVHGPIEINKAGNIKLPTTYPDDQDITIDANGNVTLPNGSTVTPTDNIGMDDKGNLYIPIESGDIIAKPDGSVELPNESVIEPGGDVTIPTQNGEINVTPDGDITIGPDGSLTIPSVQGGTVEIPTVDGAITVTPSGAITVDKDGNIKIPTTNPQDQDTTIHANGNVTLPNGSVVDPNGPVTLEPNGTVNIPADEGDITVDKDGNINVPNGGDYDTEIEAGANTDVELDGTVTVPNGSGSNTVINPDGTVTLPNG
ncbi:MAG: hypothetical protein IJD87_03055, partial [Turicibacter sp.]|nr:hypothetical protein [Turicibacter sp.]